MEAYLDIIKKILNEGVEKEDRTGVGTLSLFGMTFEHDMSKGFPILTTKKVPYGLVKTELEGFVNGITDKKWYQDRKCGIWDEWCNPKIVPYGKDKVTKEKMMAERDLGPIYGFQWRHFGAEYKGYDVDYSGQGIDQLATLVETLKRDPNSRRNLVCAWNPQDQNQMALPPCHYNFQVGVRENKLDLLWNQRSVDTALGLPFNMAFYGTMLHLLAKECGFEEGKLIGHFGDTHIYKNHIAGLEEQITRQPFALPQIKTKDNYGILNWDRKKTKLENYESHPKIEYEVAT